MTAQPTHIPACPRCGYDQRGVVATWDDLGLCPLTGVCSECGLEFAWDEVAGNLRRFPHWSFEHGRGLAPRRFWGTLARALWPWSLWSGLRMEQKTSARRVAWFLLLTLALCHGAVAAGRVWDAMGGLPLRVLLAAPLDQWWGYRQVRWAAESLAWPYRNEGTWGTLTVDRVTLWLALCAAAVPLGFVLLRASMKQARLRWSHLWRIWAYSLVGVLALAAGASLASNALGVQFEAGLWPSNVFASPSQGAVLVAIGAPARLGLTFLWLVIFWSVATRRYLRLPHAWGVGSAVVGIAFLLVTLLLLPIMWTTIGLWFL